DDLRALEQMHERPDEFFTSASRCIGAEQEMFLVDSSRDPALVAVETLEAAGDERLTTELARFNLEANCSPRRFGGDCLRALHEELKDVVQVARDAAATQGAEILLAGILPTLQQSDLGLENMTPAPRYHALNETMTRLRGGDFHVVIKGVDELELTHDNVMLEACNTSFQVHFQVAPDEFAKLYNVAQLVTAPVLAAAVNSPLLMGRRLWAETRVALFQRSVDTRSGAHQARGHRPRVHFGDAWVKNSVVEIFREDIARFRAILADEIPEDPSADVAAGRVPNLTALRLHSGTVYRWNRACYGVSGGKAHLRIENRVLPAGPTLSDEVANAAFFFGLMAAVTDEYGDVTQLLDFDDTKANFFAAARQGLAAQFAWINGRQVAAGELILKQLLPMARRGLTGAGIPDEDADHYLGIIEQRVGIECTGASWMLRTLNNMGDKATSSIRLRSLADQIIRLQRDDTPVHEWGVGDVDEKDDWHRSFRTVGQFMSTDLFTVRPEDLVDLAASLMEWEHIRHVPVEDDQGRLVGVLSHRSLLRMVARGNLSEDAEPTAVKELMKADPVTVAPDTPALEAMRLMKNQRVGCLPVVEKGRLVGIVTERDLIEVAAGLLEKYLQGN
ncbi:MAG: CBS domain-containing protein, partial [Planctomycetota bacterium]